MVKGEDMLDYLVPDLSKRKNPMYPGYDEESSSPTPTFPATPTQIGNPASGNMTGWARTESGDRSWQVFEPVKTIEKKEESKSPFAKRSEFEDSLYEKHGLPKKRPLLTEWDISKRVNEITREKEMGLFEHVFGNQARYEDRQHLDPKAQRAWKEALLQLRKNVELRTKSEIQKQQEEYDYAKNRIDEELKSYDYYERVFTPKVAAQKEKAIEKQETQARAKEKENVARLERARKILMDVQKRAEKGKSPPMSPEDQLTLEESLKDTPWEFKIKEIEGKTKERRGLLGDKDWGIPILSWINDHLSSDVDVVKKMYAASIVPRGQAEMLTPQTGAPQTPPQTDTSTVGPTEGQIYRNPKTGERIKLVNGKWEKI